MGQDAEPLIKSRLHKIQDALSGHPLAEPFC